MTAPIIHRVQCDRCEEHASDTVSIQDGHEVCSGCLRRYYTTCDECGEYVEVTFNTVGGNEVCDSCSDDFFVTCDSCGLLTNSTETTADHSDVCQHCAIIEYWLCDGCDELTHSGERCSWCSWCFRNGLIHEYSYKPSPLFHGDGNLFLGVELEINVPYCSLREIAAETQERLGNLAYLKEEESVQDGFEIVTHPMEYQWAMDHFPWGLLEHLRHRNADGENAGLHIHISRAGFSGPCHVYRWMKLLHRNAEQLTTVARRVSEQWARFDTYDRRCVKHFAKGGKGNRFQAINTRNDHTFELRVFASSLQPREVQAALGVAAASVEYTRHLTVSAITQHEGWHWSSFVAWLQQHPEYAPLRRELEALGCVC